MVLTPHLTLPSSGSSSPMRILNRVVWAISLFAHKGNLVPLVHDERLTLSSTFTPSTVLDTSVDSENVLAQLHGPA